MAFIHKGCEIKSVSLIGLGISNLGVFKYLSEAHPYLKFSARLPKPPVNTPEGIKVFHSEEQFSDMSEDIFFISPGIRRSSEDFSGKLLSSDAELFFEKNIRDCFSVTGSDGKSTTATILSALISPSYGKTYAIGNIGAPLSPHLSDPDGAAYAVELSSFQLMYSKPKSKRAVICNITPNHLNWHKDLEEYINAKKNILEMADEKIFSIDSPPLAEIARSHRSFAVFSSELKKDDIRKYKAENYVYLKDGAIFLNEKRLIPLNIIKRNENYNIKNFMAAIAASAGYSTEECLYETATAFGGLPHRCELAGTLGGTRCYNSSIDSSPDRTLATLSSFTGKCVIILGGRTKNDNYEILKRKLSEIAASIIISGENRYEIKEVLSDLCIPMYTVGDFENAVKLAVRLSEGCDNLILSPASTSFDTFKNFEERGDLFKKIIMQMKT